MRDVLVAIAAVAGSVQLTDSGLQCWLLYKFMLVTTLNYFFDVYTTTTTSIIYKA